MVDFDHIATDRGSLDFTDTARRRFYIKLVLFTHRIIGKADLIKIFRFTAKKVLVTHTVVTADGLYRLNTPFVTFNIPSTGSGMVLVDSVTHTELRSLTDYTGISIRTVTALVLRITATVKSVEKVSDILVHIPVNQLHSPTGSGVRELALTDIAGGISIGSDGNNLGSEKGSLMDTHKTLVMLNPIRFHVLNLIAVG